MTAIWYVRQVAAFGLPGHDHPIRGSRDGSVLRRPLDPATFDGLVAFVRRLRLSGLLQAAVVADALPVTEDQRRRAEDLHVSACITALQLERTLLYVVDALERAGIEVLVLKGSAAAHLLYADPTLRMFGDNDLLLRSEQFTDALEVLAELGYRRAAVAPRRGFDRRFGKGATLTGASGDELDVHRTLLFGSFGLTIDLDELFDSAVTFAVGGRELRALGPDTGLLHACYHAALGDPEPRLGSLRDVAQRFALGSHDPGSVVQLARHWRAEPVVARAIDLCGEHLGVAIADPVATALVGHRPSRQEKRAIDSYVGANRSHAAKVLASLPYLDGVIDKAAFLGANLVPAAGFVRSRGGRPGLAWLRRGVRSLRHGGAR